MASGSQERFLARRFPRLSVPLAILFAGLVLTTIAVLISQRSAEREQELLFEAAVERQAQIVENQVDAHRDDFDDAVNFVEATFPPSPEEFEIFFASHTEGGAESVTDLSIALIEIVESDDIERLEERERSLGNDSFTVVSLNQGSENLHVLTRVLVGPNVDREAVLGLDIAPFITNDFADAFMSFDAFSIPLSEVGSLANSFDQRSPQQQMPRRLVARQIHDPSNGQLNGWVVRFLEIDSLVDQIQKSSEQSINSRLSYMGESVMISGSESVASPGSEADGLVSVVSIERETGDMVLEMWADDDFGVPTGMSDQGSIGLVGLSITSALIAASVVWAVNRQRLDSASFELMHARTLAQTDALTGLLNRSGFVDAVEQADLTVGGAVYFIDLDGFKLINDKEGHAEGDRVLRGVSEAIRKEFRSTDIVSRFGGDEFVVYTPAVLNHHSKLDLASRLVEAVATADLGVTCSIGVSERSPYDLTPVETLIRNADRAMYTAKKAGGNTAQRSSKQTS